MIKIIKNKVGRPSNETISKRRIVKVFFLFIIIIFISIIIINKDKILNLKGVSSDVNIKITYECDSISGGDFCTNIGYKVTTSKKVKIKYRLGCEKVSNYTTKKTKNFEKQNINNVRGLSVSVYDMNGKKLKSKTVTFKQNGYPGKTYYYSQVSYQQAYCGRKLNNENSSTTGSCDKGNSICTSGCGGTSIAIAISTLTQSGKYNPKWISEYAADLEKKNNKVSQYCGPGVNGTTGEGIKAIVSSLGFNIKRMATYANFSGDKEKKSSSAIKKEVKKALNSGGQVIINADRAGCFTRYGHYMSIVGIKDDKVYLYDPNDGHKLQLAYYTGACNNFGDRKRNGWWKIEDLFNKGGITGDGHYAVFIITKKNKELKLNCRTGGVIAGEKITCTVNQGGVKVKVSPEKYLTNGKPIFISTESNQKMSFFYNQPATLTIEASIGDKSITKKIEVVKKNVKKTKK